MAIPTGIAAQVGVKAESVYGTPVVVDRFYEFESESIATDVGIIRAAQLGGGRFLRSDRRKAYVRGAAGGLSFIVLNKNFGLLLEHAIGQNTVSGAGANKTHTIIPDTAALQGKSLTVQIGKPDVGGTVRAFTYEGGKVKSWELKAAVDEPLRLMLDMDFENVLTATALASASYVATQEMFIFTEGAITLNAVSQSVKSFSIKGDNMLNTGRRFISNLKKEPLVAGIVPVSGTLECEFEDLTRYAAWIAGTISASLVLTFTLATVIPTTAVPFSFNITLDDIAYNGANPAVGGPDVVMNQVDFESVFDGTNPTIKLEVVTSDSVS